MSKLRIGVFGCGGMARSHASRFESILDRIEVTALADLDISRAQAVADLLPGKPLVTTDYRETLPYIDAALVVLPHDLHHSATIECLNAGKHVLCEKPLANSEQECLEMIEAARRNDRVLMTAYCVRFNPLICKLRDLIIDETFGRCFQLSIWTEQHTERPLDNWSCQARRLGGGQLFSHGCHYIDIMLWIMGKPLWGSHLGTNLGTPWMEREGTSNVSISFEGGKLGYHFGTWGARGTKLKYAIHAHCEKGMIEWDLQGGQLRYYGDAEAHVPGSDAKQRMVVLADNAAAPSKATTEEMAHFVDCVQNGTKPLTDAVSSLEGLQVIWKLYEAEDQHRLADLRGLGLGTH